MTFLVRAFLFSLVVISIPCLAQSGEEYEVNATALSTEVFIEGGDAGSSDGYPGGSYDWLFNFADMRMLNGYINWYNALSYLVETCHYAMTTGSSFCPDEPFLPWLMKNLEKLRISILYYGKLDRDELYRRFELIDKRYNRLAEIDYKKRHEMDEFIATAIPVLAAMMGVGFAALRGTHYALKNNSLFLAIARLLSSGGQVVQEVAADSARLGLTAASACIASCGSKCSSSPCTALATLMTEPIQKQPYFTLEERIHEFPRYAIMAASAKVAFELPYSDGISFCRDDVLPAGLAALYGVARLNTNKVSTLSLLFLDSIVGTVAYGSVSNQLNPVPVMDELCQVLKAGTNFMFMESASPGGMVLAGMGKAFFGLVCSDCENTMNAMAYPVLMTVPAAYFQYKKPGYRVPSTDLHPKYLVGGALIAGDMITAATGDRPEYLFIPLIALSASTTKYSRLKTIFWGSALLLAPINHLLSEPIKQLWTSAFGGANQTEVNETQVIEFNND